MPLSFFFSSRRRHTRWPRDWSSDVCSSDLTHLTLRDDALLVLVHELDRVLDRDDVVRARAVDQIDQRAQRGGLARAGWPGDEHQTLRQVAELLHFLRDAELLHAHDLGRDHAEYGNRAFAVARRVHPEAG